MRGPDKREEGRWAGEEKKAKEEGGEKGIK